MTPSLSDLTIVADLLLAIVLAGVFAIGRPRVWYRDRLGWVIFYYALTVVALLFLITYAIVFGQRVEEVYRFLVAAAVGSALIWKTFAIIDERRRGRPANQRPDERQDPMTDNTNERSAFGTPANVTTDASGKPTLIPAPKVVAGAAASGALVVLVAILTAITPELLSFAGPWAPVLFAGVVALAGFLGSYIKRP